MILGTNAQDQRHGHKSIFELNKSNARISRTRIKSSKADHFCPLNLLMPMSCSMLKYSWCGVFLFHDLADYKQTYIHSNQNQNLCVRVPNRPAFGKWAKMLKWTTRYCGDSPTREGPHTDACFCNIWTISGCQLNFKRTWERLQQREQWSCRSVN